MIEYHPSPVVEKADPLAWHSTFAMPEGETLRRVEGEGHRATITDLAQATVENLVLAQQLEHSKIDLLTSVNNRTALEEDLPLIVQNAQATGRTYYLGFFDLNKVKEVNDTDGLGHSVGDSYIRTGAHAIVDALRPTDLVYRIGGDEFVAILMKDLGSAPGSEDIQEVVRKKLQRALSDQLLANQDLQTTLLRHDIGYGISTGVTAWNPAAEDFKEAKMRADQRMYDHKEATSGDVM